MTEMRSSRRDRLKSFQEPTDQRRVDSFSITRASCWTRFHCWGPSSSTSHKF